MSDQIIQLSMTKDEAAALFAVLTHVTGPQFSPVELTEGIANALSPVIKTHFAPPVDGEIQFLF